MAINSLKKADETLKQMKEGLYQMRLQQKHCTQVNCMNKKLWYYVVVLQFVYRL